MLVVGWELRCSRALPRWRGLLDDWASERVVREWASQGTPIEAASLLIADPYILRTFLLPFPFPFPLLLLLLLFHFLLLLFFLMLFLLPLPLPLPCFINTTARERFPKFLEEK